MNYEQASELCTSSVWEMVCKELDTWIAMETERLKTCSTDQLARIQQTIHDYERVKSMANVVKDRLE